MKRNKSIFGLTALVLSFLFLEIPFSQAQNEKRPTIIFAPEWKKNTAAEFQGDIQRTVKQGTFLWNAHYIDNQKFKVTFASDSMFIVDWQAEGFPINIFEEYPGPMYDWFQRWNKGKKLNIEVKFNRLGVPLAIENEDSVRSFYYRMVDDFIQNLSKQDLSPLDTNSVKQSLINLKNLIIPSKKFPQLFIKNLKVLFPLYGSSFYKNQDQTLTHYKTLPTMDFSVPIKIHTQLKEETENIYQLISTQSPLPIDQWRIKPNDYSSLDFDYSDSLHFTYNNHIQWITKALHSLNFERKDYQDNFVVTYTKVE